MPRQGQRRKAGVCANMPCRFGIAGQTAYCQHMTLFCGMQAGNPACSILCNRWIISAGSVKRNAVLPEIWKCKEKDTSKSPAKKGGSKLLRINHVSRVSFLVILVLFLFRVPVGAQMTDGEKLRKAAHKGEFEEIKVLIQKGADVNAPDENGATALHSAAVTHNFTIVRYLVSHGADVNAKTKTGLTPLHLTAHEGFKELSLFLVQNGADPGAKTKDGVTPVALAMVRGFEDLAELLAEQSSFEQPGTDVSEQVQQEAPKP